MPLLAYLNQTARDNHGRSIEDVLRLSDTELENHHDFIQWLFPLREHSGSVPHAPVLSDEEIRAIREDEAAQDSLQKAADRMLRFFLGNEHWLVWHSHNHLRITRIISSLRLLVGTESATRFHQAILTRVKKSNSSICDENKGYWKRALDG